MECRNNLGSVSVRVLTILLQGYTGPRNKVKVGESGTHSSPTVSGEGGITTDTTGVWSV